MSRFITPYPKYSVQVRHQVEEPMANGMVRVIQDQIVADFEQAGGGLSPWEIEAALETFSFRGLPEGVNPITKLAVFDTDLSAQFLGWTQEYKTAIEERLRSLPGFGTDYIEVDRPALPKPWPTYDNFTDPVEIANFIKILGLDPETVAHYEREEGGNREEVLDAIEELKKSNESDGVDVEVRA